MEKSSTKLSILAKHLEYFGYSSEFSDEGTEIRAEHESYGKIYIRETGETMLHSAFWFISDDASIDDIELLKIINSLNSTSRVATFSINHDNALRVDAVYAGKYSKRHYAEFIDDLRLDLTRALNSESGLKSYRTQRQLSLVN